MIGSWLTWSCTDNDGSCEFMGGDSHIMSRKHFTALFPILWLLHYSAFSSVVLPEPGKGPTLTWVFHLELSEHSVLFSELWPIVLLPLQKEASFAKVESSPGPLSSPDGCGVLSRIMKPSITFSLGEQASNPTRKWIIYPMLWSALLWRQTVIKAYTFPPPGFCLSTSISP